MNNRKMVFTAFILVALVQLYIPAKMIMDKEEVAETGKEFKFRTAPIDPADPFRGKFILLGFEDNTVKVPSEKDWVYGEVIYAAMSTGSDGFAQITTVSKEKPAGTPNYLKAKVSSVSGDGSNELTIDYPFDRYYMEESKAPEAERNYRQSLQDTNRVTWALVSIKDGDAVLKDVLINGIPIREIVANNRGTR